MMYFTINGTLNINGIISSLESLYQEYTRTPQTPRPGDEPPTGGQLEPSRRAHVLGLRDHDFSSGFV
ncbi:hypothetical protein EVAR_91404_1 [Eumeta japonica]|uniref:Uncharacterized protein n=1 Tax=Eumeta variegata TaxID=151549 RepID=A0A4C1X973_EUMVA|nr:hypothetical protein EVAR_91404_1 [Eumeta japonica]